MTLFSQPGQRLIKRPKKPSQATSGGLDERPDIVFVRYQPGMELQKLLNDVRRHFA
jgi:hypothetical protein